MGNFSQVVKVVSSDEFVTPFITDRFCFYEPPNGGPLLWLSLATQTFWCSGHEGMNLGVFKETTSWMCFFPRGSPPVGWVFLAVRLHLAMGQNPNRTPTEHPNPH